jgi:1-acyl-sn-glycerol-3-phosphate acyltransferase
MGAIFPGRLRFLAKAELFEPFIFGSMVRALGATPVLKQDSQSAGAALRAFLKLLDDGENVLLFPEGGRSLDGKLQPLEGGAALIALKSGAPVVPAFVAGTFEAMPPGSKFVKPLHLSVVVGETIETAEYARLGREGRDLLLKKLEEELVSLEPRARALL